MKMILLLLFSFGLQEALGASAIINKIYHGRLEASAVVVKNVISTPGSFFVAKFQGGNVCFLEILKVHSNRVLLDLRLCSMKDYLQIGQKLGVDTNGELDVDLVSTAQKSQYKLSDLEDFWNISVLMDKIVKGFSLFLQYSFANAIDFRGTTPNQNTGAKNAVQGLMEAEGAAGIGFDYLYSRENHLGWSFEGSLDFPRNFEYLQANSIVLDFDGPIPNTELWLGIIGLNLNFTFPKTYIPYLGINVSLPFASGGDFNPSSQFGFQAGLSKAFGEHLIVDVEYRFVNFRGGIQASGEVVQFTESQLWGGLLRVKYLFK